MARSSLSQAPEIILTMRILLDALESIESGGKALTANNLIAAMVAGVPDHNGTIATDSESDVEDFNLIPSLSAPTPSPAASLSVTVPTIAAPVVTGTTVVASAAITPAAVAPLVAAPVVPVTVAPSATASTSSATVASTSAAGNAWPTGHQKSSCGIPYFITPDTTPGRFFTVTQGYQVGVFAGWHNTSHHVVGATGACFSRFSVCDHAINTFMQALSAGHVTIV